MAGGPLNPPPSGGTPERDAVTGLNAKFYDALRAMFAGDPSGFDEVFSHSDDVLYLPAEGGIARGYKAAAADWARQAKASQGGEVEVVSEDVLVQGDVAVVMTLTKVVLKSGKGPRVVSVRESSFCRRESGQWRIVTHHADALGIWNEVMVQGS